MLYPSDNLESPPTTTKSSALHSFFYAALGCCLTWEAGFGGIWNISK